MILPRPAPTFARIAQTLALTMALLTPPAHADAPLRPPRPPTAMGVGEIADRLRRLGVLGRVLYVAAHPDDENTRLLAWLVGQRGLRAAYLSLTRGDGGQNLIGSEQGPLLGLIRTQELLAARGVDGAEQLFTRARDFGYSKSPEETLSIWGEDRILADVVWAIRRFRPDVVVTRFPTGGIETHGHHTASAILAGKAFKLAADPAFHPEQLALGVTPWQPRRIVWNKSSFFIKPGEDFSAFLPLDVGGFSSSRGESWGEVAARSRTMHKSQGFGSGGSRGKALEYFAPLGPDSGEPARQDLLDGIDVSWGRIPGGAPIAKLVAQAQARFRADDPAAVIPSLLEVRAALAKLPASPFVDEKTAEVEELMVACAGLYLDATADAFVATPGGAVNVTATVLPRAASPLRVTEVAFAAGEAAVPVEKMPPPNGEPLALKRSVTVPPSAPVGPYWLALPPERGLYPVADASQIGQPEGAPPLTVRFTLAATLALPGHAGPTVSFGVTRPVVYRWVEPVAGERTRPVEVTPAVTVDGEAPVAVFADDRPRALRFTLRAAAGNAKGTLSLAAPTGWRVEPTSIPFVIADKGGEQAVTVTVTPSGKTTAAGPLAVSVDTGDGHPVPARGVLHIDHGHIPIQAVFPPSSVQLVRVDLARGRAQRLGYIAGAGDDVPAALRQVGYEVTLLSDEQLRSAPLDRFDAIVVGVRAFNTNAALNAAHARLMDYVAAGGTIVAQYSTQNRISKLVAPLGPYPFEISQERVTDENAEVTLALPGHALLARPNRIGPADFAGWVQERGLYFAGTWDDRYEAPLSLHDPGEPARKGGLLVARHGKGTFIYTGLAFFRQLPVGVPGAFRLFANLIAHGADESR